MSSKETVRVTSGRVLHEKYFTRVKIILVGKGTVLYAVTTDKILLVVNSRNHIPDPDKPMSYLINNVVFKRHKINPHLREQR